MISKSMGKSTELEKIEFPLKNQTKENVIEDIEKVKEKIQISNGERLSSLDVDSLDDILYLFESNALSIRSAIQEKFEMDNSKFVRESKYIKDDKLSNELFKKNVPVKINYERGRRLTVFTPLTIHRGYEYKYSKENFTLCDYVHIRFEEWIQNNQDVDLSSELKGPYTVFLTRKILKASRRVCDPDNLENGRIINEIFSKRLLQSDNALNVRIISGCEIVNSPNECGTLFEIIPSELISIGVKNV